MAYCVLIEQKALLKMATDLKVNRNRIRGNTHTTHIFCVVLSFKLPMLTLLAQNMLFSFIQTL